MAGGVMLPGAVERSIKQADAEYLEKHHIKALMHQILTDVVTGKPKDPIQYIVDVLTLENPGDAKQDNHGLSCTRREKLLVIFQQMDKDKNGTVDFREVQQHTSRYGGAALSEAELKEIFKDLDTTGDTKISQEEFLAFFARAVFNLDNAEFDKMCTEMLDDEPN
mmetsp:Transcript_29053/g.48778  ORF Transcript_29053/g.48778 Transcript_29053/m.48778 type:complete len:165 (+) Transcript_29053:137-631(+)